LSEQTAIIFPKHHYLVVLCKVETIVFCEEGTVKLGKTSYDGRYSKLIFCSETFWHYFTFKISYQHYFL